MTPSAPLTNPRRRPAFRRALLTWYRHTARDLPWRQTRDPYRIWLSEVMLQQTQVATVIRYYRRFVAAFPTVRDLAAAPRDQVLKLWEGLGYYSRARHLHAAAQKVVQTRCRFPRDAPAWRELPGVGRYTAAAIASIAHNEPVAVVDGNVQRILARLCVIEADLAAASTQSALWALADEVLPPNAPGDFNQAMMELGARICRPRRPDCVVCPVTKWCAACAEGRQRELPFRRPRAKPRSIAAAAALLRRRGRILIQRNAERGLLGGLWRLPTVMLRDGIQGKTLLAAELASVLGVAAEVGDELTCVDHAFTHRRLRLRVYSARWVGRRTISRSDRLRWVSPAECTDVALGRMYHKALMQVGLGEFANAGVSR